MADLLDMWDYPNNSSNGYMADSADWSGDESYGMDQRIAALKSGTYLSWPGTVTPTTLGRSTADVNTAIAKYTAFERAVSSNDNPTFYDLHYNPLVQCSLTQVNYIVDNAKFDGRGGSKGLFVTFTQPHGITTPASTPLDCTFTAYSDYNVTNNTSYTVFDASTIVFSPIDSSDIESATDFAFAVTHFIRTANEVASYHWDNGTTSWTAGGLTSPGTQAYRLLSSDGNYFTDATNDTGTIESGPVYADYDSSYAGAVRVKWYTDSGKTTGATLNEEYYGTLSLTYTNSSGSPVTYDLNNILVSDTGSPWTLTAGTGSQTATDTFAELRTHLFNESGVGSFARIYYDNLSGGTITTTLGSSLDYDELYFVNYDDTTGGSEFITCYSDLPRTSIQQFTLAAGASVDIIIKLNDPARPDASGASDQPVLYPGEDATADVTVEEPGGTEYYINDWEIILPGNFNAPAGYNWEIDDTQYWLTGGSGPTAIGAETAPTPSFTTDGSGYLSSITSTLATGGRFTSDTQRVFKLQVVETSPGPGSSTYSEDVWDTDDEWDSNASSQLKVWPTTVRPSGARIVNNMPSSVTRSQNGTKYVRSSGVQRIQLEVTYPAMTYDQFREYEAVTSAARGQETPFYFRLTYPNDEYILYNRLDSAADGGLTTRRIRLREETAQGSKTLLFEGFDSNRQDVFLRGEWITFNSVGGNGYMTQVINDDVDSNKYGEAKIRIPYGLHETKGAGTFGLKRPFWAVVTLADDDIEYNIGTDGLYRLTVRFDFDEWK